MCFVYSFALFKSVEVACIGMFRCSYIFFSPLFFFGEFTYLVHIFAEHMRRCSDAIRTAKAYMSDLMIGPKKEQNPVRKRLKQMLYFFCLMKTVGC